MAVLTRAAKAPANPPAKIKEHRRSARHEDLGHLTLRVVAKRACSKPNLALAALLAFDVDLSVAPILLPAPRRPQAIAIPSNMASVGQLTRQISALEISSKQNTTRTTTTTTTTTTQHKKNPSQTNVTKLLSKYAAPNPFPTSASLQKAASSQSIASKAQQDASRPPSPTRPAPVKQHTIDIGKYDGGFEIENETRGAKITGQAAEDLALDSSVAA